MTIQAFIDRDNRIRYINKIPFILYDVNCDWNLDIYDKTDYQDGIKYSFVKRLKMATDEIRSITKGMTKEEAKKYFKRETEEGNVHYWGGMFFVSTHYMDEYDEIFFGVRMD